MEKTIYIVSALIDDVDSDRQWLVIAYEQDQDAIAHVDLANKWQKDHAYDEEEINPFDRNPDWNSRETEYSYTSIQLMQNPVFYK